MFINSFVRLFIHSFLESFFQFQYASLVSKRADVITYILKEGKADTKYFEKDLIYLIFQITRMLQACKSSITCSPSTSHMFMDRQCL